VRAARAAHRRGDGAAGQPEADGGALVISEPRPPGGRKTFRRNAGPAGAPLALAPACQTFRRLARCEKPSAALCGADSRRPLGGPSKFIIARSYGRRDRSYRRRQFERLRAMTGLAATPLPLA